MKLKYHGLNEFHCHDRETGEYSRFMPGDIVEVTEEKAKLLKGYADFKEATKEEIAEFNKNKAEADKKEAEAVKKAQAELHGKTNKAQSGNEASDKSKKGKDLQKK